MPYTNEETQQNLTLIANTVRGLTMDATEQARSGHPGLPMGCAELGAYLWGCFLRYNPEDPEWMNRDRLVLSAGHGSMWLYSMLHLAGYDLSLEDLKNFRQMYSKTPGHPEYRETPGVEVTTGPLGQGIAMGVGMALHAKILEQRYEAGPILNHKVCCVCGDGCIMEGVSSEASSLAGHLNLSNLILIYDANRITLDGPLSDSFNEDVLQRYQAYGFETHEVNGYDFVDLGRCFSSLRSQQEKPALVMVHTSIGKGSPHKEGSPKAHGTPLGEEEVKLTKQALGFPQKPWYIPSAVTKFFQRRSDQLSKKYADWQQAYASWSETQSLPSPHQPMDVLEDLLSLAHENKPKSGRAASHQMLNALAEKCPQIYTCSADLSCSDLTYFEQSPHIKKEDFRGRNIKCGVREFAMAAACAGMAREGKVLPVCGTFLTFSDYMRPSIRLAALMRLPVVYHFTHDSIFLGEDGPTHQPIEHLMSLRAMPHLYVFRPGDSKEVAAAWQTALHHRGPTALILSRQNLPPLEETCGHQAMQGAYVARKEKEKAAVTLMATGSEVSLALNVADVLQERGFDTRVISMPCWELFESQPEEYKESVVGGDLGLRVSIEAGSEQGWYRYVGRKGITVCLESFGASAPAADLSDEFGFTEEAIVERILTHTSLNRDNGKPEE